MEQEVITEEVINGEAKASLSFEQKTEQIEKAIASAPALTEATNDDDVFNPQPVVTKLGERSYTLKPLVLSEMRLLMKLSKIRLNAGEFDDAQIDLIVECVSAILKEPDKKFIEDNLDSFTLENLFTVIQKLNYQGVPLARKGDKKKAGN